LTTPAILENPADSLDPLAAAICRNGAKVWLRRGRRIGGSRLGARGEKPYRAEKGGHEGGRKRREEEEGGRVRCVAWRCEGDELLLFFASLLAHESRQN